MTNKKAVELQIVPLRKQYPGNFLLYLDGMNRVAEWNGNIPKAWGITSKEGSTWDTCPFPITEGDRVAILKKFKLGKWGREKRLSLENLRQMSPAELMAIRREKENKYNLPRHEVYRDGHMDFSLGKGKVGKYPAEIFV